MGTTGSMRPARAGARAIRAQAGAGARPDHQALYLLLAGHTDDVVLVVRDGRVWWASPSAERVLGVPPQHLAEADLVGLFDEAPGDLLTPGSPPRRAGVRTRDGVRWFDVAVAGPGDAGALAEVTGTAAGETLVVRLRDVHDLASAEESADRAHLWLEAAFEASADGYAVYQAVRDDDGSITGLVARSIRETDAPATDIRETLAGTPWNDVYPVLVAALESGEAAHNQMSVTTGDVQRVVDGVAVPLDDDLLLVTWRDVTDAVEGARLLERAYEETAEMRVTLQTALDATSDGFAVYHLEWDDDQRLTGLRVVHANAAGAMTFGMEPDDVINQELHDLLPDVEQIGLWDRIVESAVTKAPQHLRVHVLDEEGEWERSWDYSISPVGEERMAITWRDVSAEEGALRQLARHRDEAMHSATHDALTGLPNRTLLMERLRDALRTCRPDERVGLVFVDLDRFKYINDTFGHAAGDAVLQATADRLRRLVRGGDLPARLAGDEFVIILTHLSPEWTGDDFFTRASAVLAEPLHAEGVELHPSASLGLVLADPRRTRCDADSLIKDADAAMYVNKAGRKDGSSR